MTVLASRRLTGATGVAVLATALLAANPPAAGNQDIEPDSIAGLSRLERYDGADRRDAELSFGSFRTTVRRGPVGAEDYQLAVSDQPLPECLDLRDPWELTKEVMRSGRTLVVLRLRRAAEEEAGTGSEWFVTARVFEPQIEGFESFPREAFAIDPAAIVQSSRVRGRLETSSKVQVAGPVWFLRLRVDLPLEEAGCDRS